MDDPFPTVASVVVRDGLVCLVLTASGAPETVLRMPRLLARDVARKLLSAAGDASQTAPGHTPDSGDVGAGDPENGRKRRALPARRGKRDDS